MYEPIGFFFFFTCETKGIYIYSYFIILWQREFLSRIGFCKEYLGFYAKLEILLIKLLSSAYFFLAGFMYQSIRLGRRRLVNVPYNKCLLTTIK